MVAHSTLSISLLLLFLHQALAAPDSNNITDPSSARVGWVSSDSKRSTSGILWSCFSIFLVCSWQCTHLHVPSLAESDASWHMAWGWLLYPSRALQAVFWRKIKWMIVIALAPEVGIGMAMNQYVQARRLHLRFQELGFSMTHAFYACMEGFMMAFPSLGSRDDDSVDDQMNENAMGMAGFRVQNRPIGSSSSLPHLQALSADDFETLVTLGVFPATTQLETADRYLPVTTKEDIQDRAKSDIFAKGFACLQCGWLIAQSIARVSTGLLLAKLELVTLGFILTGVVMYGLWWHKPFNVQHTTILRCAPEKADEVWSVLATKRGSHGRLRRGANLRLKNVEIKDFRYYIFNGRFQVRSIIFNLSSAIFTGIHLLAWNWEFPHSALQMLWRVFSLAALCSSLMPALVGVLYRLPSVLSWDGDQDQDQDSSLERPIPRILLAAVAVCLVVHLVSRIALIVLMFYCFSSSPAGVYDDVDWSALFPHFH
ncbi:hypothetical protein BJX70DRAFT_363517 [Aspergillus crustosus]